jgi:hypothetical protein
MPRGVPKEKEVTEEVVAVEPEVETVVVAVPEPEPVITMDDAFRVLCKAIQNNLEELPDIAHVRDVQIRFTDGHKQLAWQQIWKVAEGIIGVPY